MRYFFVVMILSLVISSSAVADVLIVPSAYPTIQSGIDAAGEGDTVIVEAGIYNENINFDGKNITVTSTNPEDPAIVAATVIDAGGSGSVVTFVNNETPDSVLTGFTITGGKGTLDTSMGIGLYWGGGIYCYRSSPTITDNVITGNLGERDLEGQNSENWSICYGGAIGCYESTATIKRNIIMQNEAYAGAGIIIYMGNDTFAGNVIYDNSADIGGGVCVVYGGQVISNTIVSNISANGGNIYATTDPALQECVISNNIIAYSIDGHGLLWEGDVELAVVTYNNFWDNTSGNYLGLPDQAGINGNISADPMFVNAAAYDYHLQLDSACIDAGDPDIVVDPLETDIDGQVRVLGGRIDIGADEYTGYFRPVADAGPDQFTHVLTSVITLDGSGSFFDDPNGVKEFYWTQTGGPEVTLNDEMAVNPTFTVLQYETYTFQLQVNDHLYTSFPDTVDINVVNNAPIADAGPYQIIGDVPALFSLDGTGSYDPDGDAIVYHWQQIDGPAVTLSNADVMNPDFEPTEPGVYIFELTVSDGELASLPDTVSIAIGNPYIQFAIDAATDGDEIAVGAGRYFENIDFKGKSIILRSVDPNDPAVVAATIIEGTGNGAVVTFYGSETVDCKLAGFTIIGGYNTEAGGGICGNGTMALISKCVISGNTSEKSGGGIFDCDGTIRYCTISGNSAGDDGGGIHNWNSSPTITNCTFSGNLAGDYGGGMYSWNSNPTITGCTFSGNSAGFGGGMVNNHSSPTVTNCILWGNTAAYWGNEISTYSSAPLISYCDIAGCGGSGEGWDGSLGDDGGGNINADPMFVDADGADETAGTEDDILRLLSGSVCIDSGDPNFIADFDVTNLDGNPRIIDGDGDGIGVVDMGAYEYSVSDPLGLLDDLSKYIIDLELKPGTENSLLGKLDAAISKLEDDNENNDATAINSLVAFINAVEAQSGKNIPEADADALVAAAQQIIDLSGSE